MPVKDLIIIGAGGYGRELLQWAQDINSQEKKWNILGFLETNPHALDGYNTGYSIIGNEKSWAVKDNQEFLIGISEPFTKEKVVAFMKHQGAKMATIIHPTAYLPPDVRLGEGVVVYPFAGFSVNTEIGDFVTIHTCSIGHDSVIGSYTTVCGFCNIMGKVQIGKGVFVGTHASFIPEVRVGDEAYIGAGSVVLRDVPSKARVFGNPARIIGYENEKEK